MALIGWLDLLPPAPRWGLLGATALGLGLPSIGLGLTSLGPGQQDLVAGAAVAAVGIAWLGVWAGLARPEAERRRLRAERADVPREHDPGLLVTPGPAHAFDPAFSLPVFHEIVLARVGSGDVVRILGVHHDADRTVVTALVEAPDACRRVVLSRPAGAASPPPDGATEPGAGGWRLDSTDDVEVPDDSPIAPSPALPAARRALLMRAEAFDLEAFEALLDELNDALDQTGETPGAAEPYLTPAGERSLRFWLRGPGLPPRGTPTTWLEVEEDGWYERIEIRTGRRVLGLLRPSGAPDEPWRLWRIRRAP